MTAPDESMPLFAGACALPAKPPCPTWDGCPLCVQLELCDLVSPGPPSVWLVDDAIGPDACERCGSDVGRFPGVLCRSCAGAATDAMERAA